ncbi:MAG: PAS domain-containing protein [Verrucomicrobia bacterium]|nr:PAS domain-containing protein [Verrucomicrobiota bacterium]
METSHLYGIIVALLAVIAALAVALILAKNKIKRFHFLANEAVPPKAEPVGIDSGDTDSSTRPSAPAVVSDAANGNELLYRQKLLNSLIDGVVLLDDKNIIAFINTSMKELLGINDSFIGLSLLEAFRSEELVSLTDTIRTVGSVVGYEYEIAGLQDKYFRINGSLGEEIPSEAPYITLVFHDLTLTRQYERQRQDFVANVSHELRTPLSMISGYVETLLGGAKDNPETLEKFLTIIEKHTNRLTCSLRIFSPFHPSNQEASPSISPVNQSAPLSKPSSTNSMKKLPSAKSLLQSGSMMSWISSPTAAVSTRSWSTSWITPSNTAIPPPPSPSKPLN